MASTFLCYVLQYSQNLKISQSHPSKVLKPATSSNRRSDSRLWPFIYVPSSRNLRVHQRLILYMSHVCESHCVE